jgi:pilus assembly protein CpaB
MAANKKAVAVVAILAVGILAFASVSLYKYLKGQEERMQEAVREAVATEKVVVSAEEIPIGTALTSSVVKEVDWPATSIPEGSYISVDEVAGRLALQTFLAGEPITEAKLMPREGLPGIMTYKIPEGHRAMTVGVDQVSGVAGFITPGSKVDVVLTTTLPGKKDPISKIVHHNIPVLATGQIIEQKEGGPVVVPTVTLDVTPEEAEKVAMSTSQGRLQLLLRRAGDEDISRTRGATITKVLSEAGKVRPTVKKAKRIVSKKPVKVARVVKRKPRALMRSLSVEIWRNNNKSVKTFRVKKEG